MRKGIEIDERDENNQKTVDGILIKNVVLCFHCPKSQIMIIMACAKVPPRLH